MLSEQNKIRFAALGIFLIAILGFAFDFPGLVSGAGFSLPNSFTKDFRLGLDLQGGTHLIYKADVSQIPDNEQDQSIEGVKDVIERRVNSFGVAEPLIQTTKSGDEYRLIVELAGITNVNEAIGLIGETPLLEFKEQNPNPQTELTPEEVAQLEETNTQIKEKAQGILDQVIAGADFAQMARENSEDPGSAVNGGDLGFVSRGTFVEEFDNVCFDELNVGEIYPELVQTQFGYHIIKKDAVAPEDGGARCSHILLLTQNESSFLNENDLWIYTGLTGEQLKRAQVSFDQVNNPQVLVEFNSEGADMFANLTKNNVGKPIAIFLDGSAISTPVVQTEITNGEAVISGQFTITEARTLAQRLNAGALPVPIELISQQTIGASLGKISVEKSLQAGIIGLILVSIFMILYYRLLGIAAVLALAFYGIGVLAIFKFVPVTLTLAGIAGFTLSVGMAVDANILIFERLKEELRKDKPLGVALKEGFARAWPSIYDGNISTLITCFILIGFTTSLVKGFAVTLTIGIIFSMFTAMVVTRVILKIFIKTKALTNLRLYGVKIKK